MSKKFWTGYILFFIFIFPMIFEYMPMIMAPEMDASFRHVKPWTAIINLGIGGLAWLFFIGWYYFRFVRSANQEIGNVGVILREGVPVRARVEKKQLKKETPAYQTLELELRLNNLAGTPVLISYEINDTKPEQRRYEIGESVAMRLDPELRPPAIVPDNVLAKKTTPKTRNYTYGFFALILFALGYLIFSYWLQNNGSGWRFLHFWHPWVMIPIWGLTFGWLLLQVLVGRLIGGVGSKDTNELVFKGKATRASVINAAQTGTYINEQPQVKYEIVFTDDRGNVHNASFKKIVNLMDLHTVGHKEQMILYLPDNPQKVMLAEGIVRG